MRNQHHPAQIVSSRQKAQLLEDALLFKVGRQMPSQASSPTGDGQAVITRQLESIVKQIVNLSSQASVAAIHGSGVNTGRIKGYAAGEKVMAGMLFTRRRRHSHLLRSNHKGFFHRRLRLRRKDLAPYLSIFLRCCFMLF